VLEWTIRFCVLVVEHQLEIKHLFIVSANKINHSRKNFSVELFFYDVELHRKICGVAES